MQLFIQSLADYNAGRIVGAWFDLGTMNASEAIDTALSMSKEPVAEEYMVADYDDMPIWLIEELGEWPSAEQLDLVADFLDDAHDTDLVALEYLVTVCGYELSAETIDMVEEVCVFHEPSDRLTARVSYAMEIIEDFYDVPKNLTYYIDYEKLARDMEYNSDIHAMGDDYLVTNCHDL